MFQNRLVKEMRLRKISDIAGCNALLEHSFLDELNKRYAIKASDETDLHRAVMKDVVPSEVLCVQERRVVGHDWCVRWLQIDAWHESLRLPRRAVLVKQLASGQLLVQRLERLTVKELMSKPREAKRKERKPVINNRRYVPPRSHP